MYSCPCGLGGDSMDSSITAFLDGLATALPNGKVVAHRVLQGRPLPTTDCPEVLPPALASAMAKIGVNGLYPHQVTAFRAAMARQDFILTAATAAGKSLAYQLPLLAMLQQSREATALYISPAKALAQQQLVRMSEMAPDAPIAMYDGDTPSSERPGVRRDARIVYTNPDMLHVSILAYHRGWSRFFRRLRYVVLDESHLYAGAFGSHVAQVLRRLERIAALYGSHPVFILLSATIGNPSDLAQALIGRPAAHIDAPGSQKADRHFILWDPTPGTPHEMAAASVFAYAVKSGRRAVLFGQTRQGVERMYQTASSYLTARDPDARIVVYRSGYTAEDRRTIEQGLFSGEYKGVVATTALELGIDIGALDVAVLAGYPGSVASMWQQAGRAGRGTAPSAAIMVLRQHPIDQHYARHVDDLLSRPAEAAVVNVTNPHVLAGHLLSAGWESPIAEGEIATTWGSTGLALANALVRTHRMVKQGTTYAYPGDSSPSAGTSIRGVGGQFLIELVGRQFEKIDQAHVLREAYPGAVYYSRGKRYLVQRVDFDQHVITVAPASDIDYITSPLLDVRIEGQGRPEKMAGPFAFGALNVSTVVRGYKMRYQRNGEERTVPLQLPTHTMNTEGFSLMLSRSLQAHLMHSMDLHAAMHAVEHLLLAAMPLAVSGDPRDLDGATFIRPDNLVVSFVYDLIPGGVGLSRAGFALRQDLLQHAYDIATGCSCESGCPSCIYVPNCARGNQDLDKSGAIQVLRALLAISADAPAHSHLGG